jgi:hypothetical protein
MPSSFFGAVPRTVLGAAAYAAATLIPGPTFYSDETPYGAASVEETDQKNFSASLLAQLKWAAIELPTNFEPFPEDGRLRDGGMEYRRSLNGHVYSSVVGLAWEGSTFENTFKDPLYSAAACDSYIIKHFRAMQVWGALHETVHYIARRFGIVDIFYKNEVFWTKMAKSHSKGEIITLASNIDERIADTAADLYILSNYRDPTSVKVWQDWRLADLKLTPRPRSDEENLFIPDGRVTHYTLTSIAAAAEAFDRRPLYRQTIVNTTLQAAQIIKAQIVEPAFPSEMKLAAKAVSYWDLKGMIAVPDTEEGREIRKLELASDQARTRLCNGTYEREGLRR